MPGSLAIPAWLFVLAEPELPEPGPTAGRNVPPKNIGVMLPRMEPAPRPPMMPFGDAAADDQPCVPATKRSVVPPVTVGAGPPAPPDAMPDVPVADDHVLAVAPLPPVAPVAVINEPNEVVPPLPPALPPAVAAMPPWPIVTVSPPLKPLVNHTRAKPPEPPPPPAETCEAVHVDDEPPAAPDA